VAAVVAETQRLDKLVVAAAVLVTQAAKEAAPQDKAITAGLPLRPLEVAVVEQAQLVVMVQLVLVVTAEMAQHQQSRGQALLGLAAGEVAELPLA
jgi:hypothetical protein